MGLPNWWNSFKKQQCLKIHWRSKSVGCLCISFCSQYCNYATFLWALWSQNRAKISKHKQVLKYFRTLHPVRRFVLLSFSDFRRVWVCQTVNKTQTRMKIFEWIIGKGLLTSNTGTSKTVTLLYSMLTSFLNHWN